MRVPVVLLLTLLALASADPATRRRPRLRRYPAGLRGRQVRHYQLRPQQQHPRSQRRIISELIEQEVRFFNSLLGGAPAAPQNKRPKQRPKGHRPPPRPVYVKPIPERIPKLDPFYMIDPPDLSKKPPSGYGAPPPPQEPTGYTAPATSGPPLPQSGSYGAPAPPAPPIPTYGAYEVYNPPSPPLQPSRPVQQTYLPPVTQPHSSYLPPATQPPNSYLPPVTQPPNSYLPPVTLPPNSYSPPATQPPNSYLPPLTLPPNSYNPPATQPPNSYLPPSPSYLPPVKEPAPEVYLPPVTAPPPLSYPAPPSDSYPAPPSDAYLQPQSGYFVSATPSPVPTPNPTPYSPPVYSPQTSYAFLVAGAEQHQQAGSGPLDTAVLQGAGSSSSQEVWPAIYYNNVKHLKGNAAGKE